MRHATSRGIFGVFLAVVWSVPPGADPLVSAGPPQARMDAASKAQDVVNVLEYEDLRNVILVGHSNGGTLITAVADRVPDHRELATAHEAFVTMPQELAGLRLEIVP